MDPSTIAALVGLAVQKLPALQTIVSNFVGMFRSTSPLLNPEAPPAVLASHPSDFLKGLQAMLNGGGFATPPLVVDGEYGKLTEKALFNGLTSFGIKLPAPGK